MTDVKRPCRASIFYSFVLFSCSLPQDNYAILSLIVPELYDIPLDLIGIGYMDIFACAFVRWTLEIHRGR